MIDQEKRVAILVDDDPLVRMTWRIAATRAGIDLRSFASMDEFEAAQESLPRDAHVYLDGSVPHGVSGESCLSRLRALGFKAVTIATGRPANKLGPEARGLQVIGKEPPFGD